MSETPSIRYDDAIAELEEILEAIENAELPIDELAPKIERAAALLVQCRGLLRATEARVEEALAALAGGDDGDQA
jgi:exodeoxyribonuclease VII small subunit